jgi:hypothetical protein
MVRIKFLDENDEKLKEFVKKWGLLKNSFLLAIVLCFIRICIDYLNLDIIGISPVITSLVAGVIFTIAVIFTGTLTDYKESEKIPGDLAASINSLYSDICMIPTIDESIRNEYRNNVTELYLAIVKNFRDNEWNLEPIHFVSGKINNDISQFAIQNAAPPILVKLRNELTNIDRISNRVKQIKDTDFIPAAYAISEIAIGFVLFLMLFIKSDSSIDAVFLLAAITFITTGLIYLIKDMDDPFEIDVGANADVDLFILFGLEKFLK